MNQVWIEFEKPKTKEEAEEICKLGNNMLQRLNDGKLLPSYFFWDDKENVFCYGDQMGCVTLVDNGYWFNLDFLGRDL